MRIMQIRPAPLGAGENVLAHFDAELTPDFRIYCVALRRHQDGGYRITSPNSFGRRVFTFTPELAERLVEAALIKLPELYADDQHTA